jgi:hypothetical protein
LRRAFGWLALLLKRNDQYGVAFKHWLEAVATDNIAPRNHAFSMSSSLDHAARYAYYQKEIHGTIGREDGFTRPASRQQLTKQGVLIIHCHLVISKDRTRLNQMGKTKINENESSHRRRKLIDSDWCGSFTYRQTLLDSISI